MYIFIDQFSLTCHLKKINLKLDDEESKIVSYISLEERRTAYVSVDSYKLLVHKL